MFRSAAALIAKKTAIVAITGVTVIGGATLALAEGADQEPVVDESTPTEADCIAAGGTWADDTCTPAAPTPEQECTDAGGTWTDDTCTPAAPTPEQECTDAGGTWTDETCTLPSPNEPELEDGVHPENHGKYVSEAAKSCKTEAAEGQNHGQCVRAIAQGQDGKPAHEDEVTETESTPTVEQPAEEPAAETMTAPAPKPGNGGGKPAHAGDGAGGKGKKG